MGRTIAVNFAKARPPLERSSRGDSSSYRDDRRDRDRGEDRRDSNRGSSSRGGEVSTV